MNLNPTRYVAALACLLSEVQVTSVPDSATLRFFSSVVTLRTENWVAALFFFKNFRSRAHLGLQAPVFGRCRILEEQFVRIIGDGGRYVERQPRIPVRHFFQIFPGDGIARYPEATGDFRGTRTILSDPASFATPLPR